MAKTLYSDKHLSIFEDKIRFKSWVLPWGKKDVMINHINKVSEKKMGFSGKEIEYPGAFDLVFQPIWYWIYQLAKAIKGN